jgi:multidrug resistance efflux pump
MNDLSFNIRVLQAHLLEAKTQLAQAYLDIEKHSYAYSTACKQLAAANATILAQQARIVDLYAQTGVAYQVSVVRNDDLSALAAHDAEKEAQYNYALSGAYARAREAEQQVESLQAQVAKREEDVARLRDALEESSCRCECATHGYGCGLHESTCQLKTQCKKCKALAATY